MVKSLYVHIPFCRQFCPYCDFPKLLLASGFQDKYTDALLKEDERYLHDHFETIFLGGGTPSCLSLQNLTKLVQTLLKRHGTPLEMTIECNPEDVNPSFVKTVQALGFNRISLGLQTTDDKALKALGRNHTYADCKKAVQLFQQAGITNVSVDFIYGLPHQTMDDIQKDLEAVKEMELPHCSFYALQIEPHTKYFYQHVQTPSPDLLADFYQVIVKNLEKMGLFRYEVSNFARPGYESKHNLCYWHSDDYAAIGIGATSFVNGVREVRTQNLTDYFSGKYLVSQKVEDLRNQEFDFIMLNLRLKTGFSLREYTARFHKDFLKGYGDKLVKLKDFLDIDQERVRVKPKYIYTLDEILVELLNFEGID